MPKLKELIVEVFHNSVFGRNDLRVCGHLIQRKYLDYLEKYELEELKQFILKAFEALYTSNPLSKRLKELNLLWIFFK
ncbi:MAG: hypothetical protein ACTSRI_05005 [Promethearchaeota archaeon]